jgi:parallel beta-helix repeat protein
LFSSADTFLSSFANPLPLGWALASLYLGQSSGVTVRNSWVYDCADRSIQLSPDTDNALVIGSLVDSDHQAGILLGDSADNNTIRNNVVDAPNGKTIYTGGQYFGSGNAVIDNCV